MPDPQTDNVKKYPTNVPQGGGGRGLVELADAFNK